VPDRPEIVCICGSARFVDEMRAANRDLTFAGVIVVAPGVFPRAGDREADELNGRRRRLPRQLPEVLRLHAGTGSPNLRGLAGTDLQAHLAPKPFDGRSGRRQEPIAWG
jgi:hypothetical protein